MFSVGSIYTKTSFPLNRQAFEDSFSLIKASQTSEEQPYRVEIVLETDDHIKQIYLKVFLNSYTNMYLLTNYCYRR